MQVTLADMLDSPVIRSEILEQRGDLALSVTGITDDSRQVKPGALFVAVKGERVDGHQFLPQVLQAGAAALVVQQPQAQGTVPVILVKDSRRTLGFLGSRFYGDPSSRLRMVGVTGTNGKTTITYLTKAVLESAERKVGLIGTVAYQIGEELVPAAHTTPGALELQALLSRMVSAGMDTAVMEVSSHALALDRTVGCEYDVAVFTNLTQDHLDFHRDMDDYFSAKLKLFTGLAEGKRKPSKRAIVNLDDPWSERIRKATAVPLWTYGIKGAADLRAEDLRLSASGTTFSVATPHGRAKVESRLVGEHNVYNALAAVGVGLQEGLSLDLVCQGIASVRNVPGRFERVEAGQPFTVVVDYAHTEDALVRLLSAAQALRPGRIITVFGCGGDRDRTKRPKMGRAAVERSDVVVLTSDNPRTEQPQAILQEVEVGVKDALRHRPQVRCHVIADRRAAIKAAVREARPGDMVVIAGKGHEDYQIIGTTKHHFDDREVAREAILSLQSV